MNAGPDAGARPIVVVGPPGAEVESLAGRLRGVGLPAVAPGAEAAAGPDADSGRLVPDEEPTVVVIAWRSAAAAVGALGAEGVAPAHAVAQWEATLVHALRDAAGRRVVGLDLDRPAEADARLAEWVAGFGITEAPAATDVVSGPPADPETAALIAAIDARLAPALAAAAAVHESWSPPADLAVGPTSAALLAAHQAAARSAADAEAAWAATHAAEVAARDAKAAVEREHRELVGPDPMHYRELRRELWRLRDEFAGIVAGRTNYHTAWMRADAERLVAEQRVHDLLGRVERAETDVGPVRAQRDAMLASRRWWLGGLVTRPLGRLLGRTPPS